MKGVGLLIVVALSVLAFRAHSADSPLRDPAAWGSDHVGKAIPEFVSGDECLFCHRHEIGAAWQRNRHNLTVRRVEADAPELAALMKSPVLKEFAGQVRMLLGDKQSSRYLKPAAAYGHVEMLATATQPRWDAKKFGDRCAGCHCTAVDAQTRSFAALSLDCYTCHGDVPLNHSKDASLAYLSKKRSDSAAVITSICAHCHVRTGRSRSTGLPYANNFVAGDNLFRDFQVDFSPDHIKSQNPADAHVLDNVRRVVLLGQEETTCLTCHNVHKASGKKHHGVPTTDFCLHCHNGAGSKKIVKPYEVHSRACEY